MERRIRSQIVVTFSRRTWLRFPGGRGYVFPADGGYVFPADGGYVFRHRDGHGRLRFLPVRETLVTFPRCEKVERCYTGFQTRTLLSTTTLDGKTGCQAVRRTATGTRT